MANPTLSDVLDSLFARMVMDPSEAAEIEQAGEQMKTMFTAEQLQTTDPEAIIRHVDRLLDVLRAVFAARGTMTAAEFDDNLRAGARAWLQDQQIRN
jgi:HPt (histidine-containing phosphotransfer) domain-containing protein